jgi:putative transposase
VAKHNLSKTKAFAAVELSRSSGYQPVPSIEERDREVIIEWRGKPDAIHVDNGSEYISQVFADWCEEHDIKLNHIQPGKPNQNAYIERFNRTYRHEVLNAYVFESLRQVREITRG